jgi:hypothetical protein
MGPCFQNNNNNNNKPGTVSHACNSSYTGSGDWEDWVKGQPWKLGEGSKLARPHLKKNKRVVKRACSSSYTRDIGRKTEVKASFCKLYQEEMCCLAGSMVSLTMTLCPVALKQPNPIDMTHRTCLQTSGPSCVPINFIYKNKLWSPRL